LDAAGRACRVDEHKAVLFHAPGRLVGGTAAATQDSTDASATSSRTTSSRNFAGAERLAVVPPDADGRSESRLQVLLHLRPSVSCESLLPVPAHSILPPLTARQSSSSLRLSPATLHKSWAPASRSDDHFSLPDTRTPAFPAASTPAERVAVVMACTAYPPEVLTKVDAYKQKLNTSAAEWTVLGREDDARVLSALMWDWLDELKVNTSHTHTHTHTPV